MLPVKARRNPVPLSLGVGGGAGTVIPPDVVYAKPKAHAIYYAATFPAPTIATLAKYNSVQIATLNTGGSISAVKTAIDALRLANPLIELFNYNISSETGFPSPDFGGTYGNRSGKLTAADWLLRNAANQFYITFGTGDGTFLPDRGAWAPATSYAFNDVVLQSGVYYKCTSAHTSPGSFSTASGWTSSLGIMAINIADGVLPDHLGVNWAQYYARHIYVQATRDGCTWDGAYLDLHGYPDEAIPLDWENTGSNVRADATASVKRKIEACNREFVTELEGQFGAGFKIIGNVNGGSLLTEYVVTQGMSAYADGWLHETTVAPSVSSSYLCIGGIGGPGNTVMGSGWDIKAQQVRDPVTSYSVLGVKPSSITDYATTRLGIALAMMQNARPALTPPGGYSSTSVQWADEFEQPIGVGIDPVQYAAVTGNIWKRRFQNGVVLINESKLAPTPSGSTGAWASGVSYSVGNYRYNGSTLYVCAIAHTSGTFATDLAAGRWTSAEWVSGVAYAQGARVSQGGFQRVCKYGQGHTSGTFATDLAAGRWHTMTNLAGPQQIAGAPVTIDSSIIPYGIYKRFSGTQDPVTNSGAVVSGSFSLAGWDAILLLCVTPGVHS